MENLSQIINNIVLPQSQRTIGSEKALIAANETFSGSLNVVLQFGFPAQHLAQHLCEQISSATGKSVELDIHQNIVAHKVQAGVRTIQGVKNIIAVASGKGGVGKSTTTANLATALHKMGARVGVLDADLYGPSQPTMLGVAAHQPQQQNGHFIPVKNADGIQVMSIGFLIDPDQAVVWRGPMVSQALQQLLFQSEWDDVDYLFIDLPPGTGDIQLTLSQKIPVTGAVIVTTPQDIALIDARKAIDMFHKVNIDIVGVLENMSVHVCSNCGHHEAIFGADGGKALAEKLHVPLLGQLPLSLPVRVAMDEGKVGDLHTQNQAIAEIYQQAAFAVALAIADKGRDFSSRFPKIVVE
ncbi:iron-sulfur cluster carrier protein ApbC [Alysiella filiformis]|uniref:Iron-sulfur cluster carrier protein n=1 Tax=Alysiella filiformis DSM 16848 TaxID=1120981 RepID=A0A286EG09_9NEIS|nr:iron-sulfur cluster carrier protein ApbC [Alysiella filiformis]QMT30490.1 iron-sulfur cluster carrier protein ApbC [Alysiella filiformis]UBQ56529.1 iron-sulfur cluster carrier protein ApbC [Alysiella filiformis DSM 16848]SOD69754.1 ATP-binding protein involved in chromosome partitioning [Alysiella filiformis DSM 16848]